MKNSKITRSLAITLALITLFTALLLGACSCRFYRRNVFDYNAIEYSRPDYSAIEQAFREAEDSISSDNIILLSRKTNTAMEKVDEFLSAYTYVNVEYNKDSVAYGDEYRWLSQKYNDVMDLYYSLLYKLLESEYEEDVFEGWSEEDKQSVRDRYEVTGEEYTRLQNEITDLQMQYNELDGDIGEEFALAVEDIYLALIDKNKALAKLEGYDDYAEYAYENAYGRSYEPAQAKTLEANIKQHISPILNELYDYESLKQYVDEKLAQGGSSGSSDSSGSSGSSDSNISIFYDYIEYAESTVQEFTLEIGNDFAEAYDYMKECNLLFKSTPNNAPNALGGSFTTYLYGYEAPFMFVTCDGSYADISTYVHEFGHFAEYYINGQNGGSELDIAEIHSQGAEMLFMPYYKELFTEESANEIENELLFNTVYFSVIMGCMLDEFQCELYTNTDEYRADGAITELFDKLLKEYNADEYGNLMGRLNGYEFKYWWSIVSHNIEVPFYYISYAMSALPALIVYEDSMVNRAEAIESYNYVLTYGDGTYGFEELLTNAGLASPFSSSTISSLADFLKEATK